MPGKKRTALALAILVVVAVTSYLVSRHYAHSSQSTDSQPVLDVCSNQARKQANTNDKNMASIPKATGEIIAAGGTNHDCAESVDFDVKANPHNGGQPDVETKYIAGINTVQIRIGATVLPTSPQGAAKQPITFAQADGWKLLRDLRGLSAALPPGDDAVYNLSLTGKYPFTIQVTEVPRSQDFGDTVRLFTVSVIFYPDTKPISIPV